MQATEGAEAPDRDRDPLRHARLDFWIEQDPPAGYFANIDERGLLVASAAPTEPQVTNVTAASTAGVAEGDDECIPAGMLIEPLPCPLVEDNGEFVHRAIMV